MKDWKEKAYKFAQTTDRGYPPHFVGRDDVLKRIANVVEDLRERADCGPTIVLTGAQGSGKTALLREVKGWAGEQGLFWIEIQPDEMSYRGLRHVNETLVKVIGCFFIVSLLVDGRIGFGRSARPVALRVRRAE